jgi:hypothetical protein
VARDLQHRRQRAMIGRIHVMSLRTSQRWAAAVLLALGATGARADGTRLTVNDLPPVVVRKTPVSALSSNESPERAILSSAPAAPAERIVSPAVPREVDHSQDPAAGVDLPQEAPVRFADLLNATIPDPPAGFVQTMANPYGITDAGEVRAAYGYYLKERPALQDDARIGNAVVQLVQKMRRPPAGPSHARPLPNDPALTTARSGVVRAGATIVGRKSPWGDRTGTPYSSASGALSFDPPAVETWYHVKSSNEWVSGLWLEFPR